MGFLFGTLFELLLVVDMIVELVVKVLLLSKEKLKMQSRKATNI